MIGSKRRNITVTFDDHFQNVFQRVPVSAFPPAAHKSAGCHWILTTLVFNLPNVQDEVRCHIDVLALLLLLPMMLSVFPAGNVTGCVSEVTGVGRTGVR